METRIKTARPVGEVSYEEARRQIADAEVRLKARERVIREREQELREREEAFRVNIEGTKTEKVDPLAFLMKEILTMRAESQYHMPNHQVNEALALIPKYDGKNIPLSSFINLLCKRARQMIPAYPEKLFTQATIRKLHDSAYVAMDWHNPRTMLALCSRLRQTLGSYHSIDYHRIELKNVLMSENEQVVD